MHTEVTLNNHTGSHKLHAESDIPSELFVEASDGREQGLLTGGPEEVFRKVIMPRLPLYQNLAQKAGFWIEFGEATCWDHERKTIVLAVKDFIGKGLDLSPSMLDYLILHELGHMKELYEDPDGYQDVIDTGLEKYGNAAFRLYNCLMDVYVNSNTAQSAPIYGSTNQSSNEVKLFYHDQAFRNRDFQRQPHALQFAHHLLNLGMGIADDIVLSPEVQERIDRGVIDPSGNQISYQDFLDLYMRPAIERESGDLWQGLVSQRKRIIDRLIRPDFEQFLSNDIASGRAIVVPSHAGVGTLMSPQSLKKIVDDAKRVKKEGKPSSADRQREQQLRDIGKDLEMPVSTVNDFISTFNRMQPTINSLAKVWDELRFVGEHRSIGKDGYYARGIDLDVQRVVGQFPQILHSPENALIMYRRVPKDERIPIPRQFNLRIIIDTSGSMACIQQQVRETAVALGASLYVKNQEAALRGDAIACGFEVHRFSGDSKNILPCTNKITVRDLMSWYPEVTMGGGTSDHFALMTINNSITGEAIERIGSGSQVEIVIEITDGDTSNPGATKEQIKILEKKGVLVGAINLSNSSYLRSYLRNQVNSNSSPANNPLSEDDYDQGIVGEILSSRRFSLFDQIWNSGEQKRGLYVEQVEELPKVLGNMISRFIELSPAFSSIE
jgi:hypothetical protein